MKSQHLGSTRIRKLILALVLLTSCASIVTGTSTDAGPTGDPIIDGAAATTTAATETTGAPDDTAEFDDRSTITVPLSLYVVLDEADPAGSPLSSQRTEADLEVIAGNMATIWAQADVVFDPVNIETIEATTVSIEGIAAGLNTDAFFAQAGNDFEVPNLSAVNGFYVRSAGRVNGFAPLGNRLFFVVDEPSVNDERVSSHEVGHIFGLHHDLRDPGTLMFSGTNGTVLSDTEQLVARYTAQGILNGAR